MNIIKNLKTLLKINTNKSVKLNFYTLKHKKTLEILVNNYNKYISLENALIKKKEIKELNFILKKTDSTLEYNKTNKEIKLIKC